MTHPLGKIDNMENKMIDTEQIAYMKFVWKTYIYWNEPPLNHTDIKFYPDGRIIKCKRILCRKKVNLKTEKNIGPDLMKQKYLEIADFLSTEMTEVERWVDDSEAFLKIFYKDGHDEKYDRGLGFKGDCLYNHLNFLSFDEEM